MSTENLFNNEEFNKFIKKYTLINVKYLNTEVIKQDFLKVMDKLKTKKHYKKYLEDNEDEDAKYNLTEYLHQGLDSFTGESKTSEYGESWLYEKQIDLTLLEDFLKIFNSV